MTARGSKALGFSNWRYALRDSSVTSQLVMLSVFGAYFVSSRYRCSSSLVAASTRVRVERYREFDTRYRVRMVNR